jgi:hypothetical protein
VIARIGVQQELEEDADMRSRVALFKAEQQRQAPQQQPADALQQPAATSDEDDDFPEVTSQGWGVYKTGAERSCLSTEMWISPCIQVCRCSHSIGDRKLALMSVQSCPGELLTFGLIMCGLSQVPLEELLDDLAGLKLSEVEEAAAAAGLPASTEGASEDGSSQQDMEH